MEALSFASRRGGEQTNHAEELRADLGDTTVRRLVVAQQLVPAIDSHVHVWKRHQRFPSAPETKNVPAKDASAEMLIALMKANGVSRTVIQVIYYRWDNRYLASLLKEHPHLFQGVARVNPKDPAAPDHLTSLTEEQGFRGVRISPAADASGDWIRGPLMPPFWKRCCDLKVMTVLTLVDRLPDVAKLIEKFPDLTVVIDHMAECPLGQPRKLAKRTALERYPNVFVKISHMCLSARLGASSEVLIIDRMQKAF